MTILHFVEKMSFFTGNFICLLLFFPLDWDIMQVENQTLQKLVHREYSIAVILKFQLCKKIQDLTNVGNCLSNGHIIEGTFLVPVRHLFQPVPFNYKWSASCSEFLIPPILDSTGSLLGFSARKSWPKHVLTNIK